MARISRVRLSRPLKKFLLSYSAACRWGSVMLGKSMAMMVALSVLAPLVGVGVFVVLKVM